MKTKTETKPYGPLSHWLLCHIRALLFGLGEMVRTPFATLLTLIVIGIAMSFPAGLYILLQNFQGLNDHWNGSPSISLYLKQNTSPDQIAQLTQQLQNNTNIQHVQYISPKQGLTEFSKLTQFGNILSQLTNNPLPPVIVVTPAKQFNTPTDLNNLLTSLKQIPQVDVGQLDMAWVKRLYYIVTLSKRIVYAMAILFSIGVILIVGNTIRLTTQTHQQEMNVLKLIGATHAFIRRPMLYRGLIYGLLGGLIAWSLVSVMLEYLQAPAAALAKTYNSILLLQGLGIQTGLSILLSCSLLGLIGSWLATNRHLNAPESS